MNCSSAQTLLESIDSTLKEIKSISGADIVSDSYFAKFLIVFICGMYEEAIENILIDFISRKTLSREVISYARASINQTFRNPDYSNIFALIKKFGNPQWEAVIGQMTQEARALDNLVTNKNGIAHGYQKLSFTISEVEKFYLDSRPLLETLDALTT